MEDENRHTWSFQNRGDRLTLKRWPRGEHLLLRKERRCGTERMISSAGLQKYPMQLRRRKPLAEETLLAHFQRIPGFVLFNLKL
jgi:hypothetical protein